MEELIPNKLPDNFRLDALGVYVRRVVVHWGLTIGFAGGFAAYVSLLFARLP